MGVTRHRVQHYYMSSRATLAMAECLERRKAALTFRRLMLPSPSAVDFSSNDYLGFARDAAIHQAVAQESAMYTSAGGSTGSRLLSGNSEYAEALERRIGDFHGFPSALLFNSGFDANYGVLSSVPQPGDVVIFDELVHNSMREGIRASRATSASFAHNNVSALRQQLQRHRSVSSTGSLFVAVESVYSMDGDIAPLRNIVAEAKAFHAEVIVDEAHGIGSQGDQGRGTVHQLGLTGDVFATIYTFGKALGAHGAAVVGSEVLRDYLIVR